MADSQVKANNPPSIGGGPVMPPKRPATHVEKARAILSLPLQDEASAVKKVTARITGEQFEWLRGQAKGYKVRHPKRGRVTIEQLVSVAVEHLRSAANLDGIIAKHRS